MLATLWLVAVLIGLAAWTVRDKREYAVFKTVQTSEARRAFYRRWTWQSFVFLVGGTAATLFILDAGDALFGVPSALAGISEALAPRDDPAEAGGDRAAGFAVGVVIGLVVLVIVQLRRIRTMIEPVTGDIEPLLPRNRAEMIAALPLCINASISEELFFRIALPLLITHVTGSATIGLAGAVLLFGLIHAYQGWKGVVATTIAGAVLTLIYLRSGSIVQPIVFHALMDIVALIIRPWLSARLAGRSGAASAIRSR